MFDLSKNNLAEIAEEGYTLELVIPDTVEKTGAWVKVRGSDSKVVKNFYRKLYQENNLKQQKAKRQGKEAPEPTLEEMDELSVESAVIRIINWGGIGENGVEVPFTKENAERILKEHDWIRAAILDASSDGSKFRPE